MTHALTLIWTLYTRGRHITHHLLTITDTQCVLWKVKSFDRESGIWSSLNDHLRLQNTLPASICDSICVFRFRRLPWARLIIHFFFLLAVLLLNIPGECEKALQVQFVIIIIIRLSYQEVINWKWVFRTFYRELAPLKIQNPAEHHVDVSLRLTFKFPSSSSSSSSSSSLFFFLGFFSFFSFGFFFFFLVGPYVLLSLSEPISGRSRSSSTSEVSSRSLSTLGWIPPWGVWHGHTDVVKYRLRGGQQQNVKEKSGSGGLHWSLSSSSR